MMMSKVSGRAATALAAVAMSFAVGAQPSWAEELRLSTFVSPLHVVNRSVIEPLVEGVAAETGGDMNIRVFPGGELGGALEHYVMALQGVADITWFLPGYTSSQFMRTMIVEMPGAIPEGMTGYQMMWNAFDEHLQGEFPMTRPLAMWTSEPSIIIMRDRDVRVPGDLAGLRIRVSGAMQGGMVEEMGGTPVQMQAGEIYNALQTGLIDGLITGPSAVADFRLDEIANSYTLGAPLGTISFILVMNEQRYQALAPEHRAAIDAHSGLELSRSGEEAWNRRSEETIARIREAGVARVIDLSEDEVAAFGAVLLPITERLVSEMGAQAVFSAMRGE